MKNILCVTVIYFTIYLSLNAAEPVTETKGHLAGHKQGAVFEVVEAQLLAENSVNNYVVRNYSVVVKITEILPDEKEVEKLTLLVERRDTMVGRSGPQDWFPLEVGSRFVALFNVKKPRDASELLPLAVGDDVPRIWEDCVRFYKIALLPEKEMRLALVQAIKEQRQTLTYRFFEFLYPYYASVYDDDAVMTAFAEYLKADDVPLDTRITISKYAGVVRSSNLQVQKQLADAIVKCILDSDGHKVSTVSLYERLLESFISQNLFPNLDKMGRKKLRSLMPPNYKHRDSKVFEKFKDWLDEN